MWSALHQPQSSPSRSGALGWACAPPCRLMAPCLTARACARRAPCPRPTRMVACRPLARLSAFARSPVCGRHAGVGTREIDQLMASASSRARRSTTCALRIEFSRGPIRVSHSAHAALTMLLHRYAACALGRTPPSLIPTCADGRRARPDTEAATVARASVTPHPPPLTVAQVHWMPRPTCHP